MLLRVLAGKNGASIEFSFATFSVYFIHPFSSLDVCEWAWSLVRVYLATENKQWIMSRVTRWGF